MSVDSTSWARSRRRHALRGSGASDFEQRAAAAWIRAADAGVIDAGELGWLLDTLQELQGRTDGANRQRWPRTEK